MGQTIRNQPKGSGVTRIHVEAMMYRDVIWVPGASLMTFALIKLIPNNPDEAESAPPPVNVALALDISGSMYETDNTRTSRLRRVQRATGAALDLLRPEDRVALVAFG